MTKIRLLDKESWIKNPFNIKLGKDFKNFKEVVEYQEQLQPHFSNKIINLITGRDATAIQKMYDIYSDDEATPKNYLMTSTSDAVLGGNEAINSYWQFNRDDDIVHITGAVTPGIANITGVSGSREHIGVSRVYNEMYNRTQQILWLQFGVPEFAGLSKFYSDAFNTDLVQLHNAGREAGIMSKIANLFVKAGTVAFTLPFLAIKWLVTLPYKLASLFKDNASSRYYDFKPCMALYYRMANGIALTLAVNMNLYDGGFNPKDSSRFQLDKLPKVYPDGKLDVLSIITRKAERYLPNADMTTTPRLTVDSAWKHAQNEETKDSSPQERKRGFFGTLSDSALGLYAFVGFRIEKSTDSSESFSNSTGQSGIAGMVNSSVSEKRDQFFTIQNGKATDGVVGSLMQSAGDMFQSAASMVGMDTATGLMAGNGFIDIPEVWKESSFSKSYSFDIALRSWYGDPLSIYQSIYFPLALLVTGALPRAVGASSYTSPFLVRAYSKGMFGIPLGIIDSMTVKRGSAEHGWNFQNLPTSVDVSFTIKDLSPAMFMALPGEHFISIFGENTSFQEYMSTLSGFGLQQRLSKFENMMKRAELNWRFLWDDRLSPTRWAMEMGESNIAQMIANIIPYNGLSKF